MSGSGETRGGFWRENSLTLVFGLAFLVTLAFQAITGNAEFNEQMAVDGLQPVGFADYLVSSDFAVDVTENWQSEFLQFFLYIFGTVYLVQRGSPESKQVHRAGPESEREQRMGDHARHDSPRWAGTKDWRQTLYARSLGSVMGALFILSWLAQSISGTAAYNGRAAPPAPGPRQLGRLRVHPGLLEPHPPELAVRAPRGRRHGRPVHLPPPARVPGIQAGRRLPYRHRRRGLTPSGGDGGMRASAAGRRPLQEVRHDQRQGSHR